MQQTFAVLEKGKTMNKELAIECIKTQRQFVDVMTREAFDMAIDLIKENVAPVRHGWWVVIDAEEPRRYGCSECKRLSWNMENYCGNCGAKMDGDADD